VPPTTKHGVLLHPVGSLDDHHKAGGGEAARISAKVDPATLISAVTDAGLRGRGGAGFPTGVKWQTVAANRSAAGLPTTVVVNGAEGEPGSFKDRAILRANPYRVLEGAVIAARAVGADRVVVALKERFTDEVAAVRRAIDEVAGAGWADGVAFDVLEGPDAYLFGEETALLEVLDGRPPFPRVAPPFRHGADELGDGGESAADVDLAGPGAATAAPPTLVDNVETLAHGPGIVVEGPDWFRSVGTAESPGTLVCTVSGPGLPAGVVEVAMGTPLSEVIEAVTGRAPTDVAVLPGVANALLPPSALGTPLTYEDMAAAGSGLGCGAFLVFEVATDPVAIAAGVARFLAVESCGQCTPCKQDGLAVAERLGRWVGGEASPDPELELAAVEDHLRTITDGARCYLATQHQVVVSSVLALYPGAVQRRVAATEPVEPVPIAAIGDLVDRAVVLDADQATKQPDWSHDSEDSGRSPADRLESRGP
jgi:NADH:ubiquinone oxidoreductase subunit F (NADH-binding)